MIDEIISDILTVIIFLFFIVYVVRKRGFDKLSYVLLLLAGGMIIVGISDIIALLFVSNVGVECMAGRVTAFGVMLAALGLISSLSMFPKKNIIYKAIPSLYIVSSLLVVYLFFSPHFLYCDPLWGGTRGSLWVLYSLWVYELLFFSAFIAFYSVIKSKTRVERMQFLYMSIGSLIVLVYLGIAQIVPYFLEDVEYFTAVHVLPFMGIFFTIALIKYGMYVVSPIRESHKPIVCELDVIYGEINGIYNINAAYKSFRKEISKVPGMVITIRPPDVLKNRYVMEKTPILWLTYFPYLYDKTIIPDRLHFEVMYSVINFVDNGGEIVLIDGVEYLIENFGRGSFLEFVKGIKEINGRVTVVLAIHNEKVVTGFADVVKGKNCRIADPRIIIIKDERELTKKEELYIITTRDKESIEREFLGHLEILRLGDEYSVDHLLFEGINKIELSTMWDLYIDCTDYIISLGGEKKFMNFLKDAMDIILPRGGNIYLKYTPRAEESLLIAPLIEDIR